MKSKTVVRKKILLILILKKEKDNLLNKMLMTIIKTTLKKLKHVKDDLNLTKINHF